MTERIILEVPATLGAISTVRMVLGGLGARLDFSLDDVDDLYLATDYLLEAALEAEDLSTLRVACLVEGSSLRMVAGPFHSTRLRERIAVTPGGCIDLCSVLRRLADEVLVEEDGDVFRVVIMKRRSKPVA